MSRDGAGWTFSTKQLLQMTRTDSLKKLIRLGEGSRRYWTRELPKRHPKWPFVQNSESSGPPPPEHAEIQKLLASLRDEDLYLLCLLMYVGRGDFDMEHLKPAYRKLRDAFPSRESAIDQMLGMTELSEYLTDAWDEAQKRHIDLDSPSFVASTVN
jgi:hypothetical protein